MNFSLPLFFLLETFFFYGVVEELVLFVTSLSDSMFIITLQAHNHAEQMCDFTQAYCQLIRKCLSSHQVPPYLLMDTSLKVGLDGSSKPAADVFSPTSSASTFTTTPFLGSAASAGQAKQEQHHST